MPEERFALDCILKQIEGDVPVPVTLVLWYEDEPPLMVGFGLSFGLPGWRMDFGTEYSGYELTQFADHLHRMHETGQGQAALHDEDRRLRLYFQSLDGGTEAIGISGFFYDFHLDHRSHKPPPSEDDVLPDLLWRENLGLEIAFQGLVVQRSALHGLADRIRTFTLESGAPLSRDPRADPRFARPPEEASHPPPLPSLDPSRELSSSEEGAAIKLARKLGAPSEAPARAAPSGLAFIDAKVGAGPAVDVGCTVRLHYTAWLADGTEFARTDEDEPLEMQPGSRRAVVGFEAGVLGMRPGGIRKLIIPPEMGYGATGAAEVPPNATLILEVRVLEVR
jgi:hypothetical protein